jgi:hypothetical protein
VDALFGLHFPWPTNHVLFHLIVLWSQLCLEFETWLRFQRQMAGFPNLNVARVYLWTNRVLSGTY